VTEPIYTPRATADLAEIWQNIALDDPLAADHFIKQLMDAANRLAVTPRAGRLRPEYRKGIRSLPHGNYLILYEVVENRVRLIHFVHGQRNIKALFRRGEL
jgi:toxin ParE1/3/4